jgi:uncharacterized protein with PQ loop repeat
MKSIKTKNKKGGFTDLLVFLIFAFVIVLCCGIYIYIANITTEQLHLSMDGMDIGDGNRNASETIDNTMGKVTASFDALYWISVFLIFGMIIAIFIGSYMVTTKPIFFIPYLFIVFIAVIVAVPISNAYETLRGDATLGSTYAGFTGANYVMNYLPMIVVIVGIVGGIIMFSRMGKREEMGGIY